ncbi:hypothetical protein GCM10027447_27120 [Glycomyces halotolerans]
MLVGIFGAIGRETKGAMRSLQYDLRRSKRFRHLGVLAVATVASGVVVTGALLRGPVPELMGVQSDENGSGITDGWFGFDSGTQGQDAEVEESTGGTGGVGNRHRNEPGQETTTAAPASADDRTSPERQSPEPTGMPGLSPVEEPSDHHSPEQSPTSPGGTLEPSPEPEPTPTHTSPSPSQTASPSPSETPSQETPSADATPSE